MSAPQEPPGPHNLPPGEQTRHSVPGRRLDGDTCTVIIIRDPARRDWVLYPYGCATMGVRISEADARTAAEFLLNRGGRR